MCNCRRLSAAFFCCRLSASFVCRRCDATVKTSKVSKPVTINQINDHQYIVELES